MTAPDYKAIVEALHPDIRVAAIALTSVTVPDGWKVEMLSEGWIGVAAPAHDGVSYTFHVEPETATSNQNETVITALRWRVGNDFYAECQEAIDAIVAAHR